MNAYLRGVQYYLPAGTRSNDDLVADNPGWDADKIYDKIGIRTRHIAADHETASDLGYAAADSLLEEVGVDRGDIDMLLYCTQSPDYLMPASACILQQRLGLPVTCGALDYNLGCSGFTYGLWLARSLILSGSASNVLLILADTYSRYCEPHDLTTVTIFGDAGAAALISSSAEGSVARIEPSVVGSDGRGAKSLIVRAGAARMPESDEPRDKYLYMNGPEVFSFTLSSVKDAVDRLLEKLELAPADVDWFLFHQANAFMLKRLGAALEIPESKLPLELEDVGNTVSVSIPILMRRKIDQGCFRPGQKCLLAGFGVGFSWAMTGLTIGAE